MSHIIKSWQDDLNGIGVLEIGGGDHRLMQAVQVDAVKRQPRDFVCCWGSDSLPFADETFGYVYSSHCLEHVPYQHTSIALRDAWRVLKVGGVIELWTPDLRYYVDCYLAGKPVKDGWLDGALEDDLMYWINARIFNYAKDGDDSNLHRAVFDEAYLKLCLERVGFTDVIRLQGKSRTRDHGSIQLGMTGVKKT